MNNERLKQLALAILQKDTNIEASDIELEQYANISAAKGLQSLDSSGKDQVCLPLTTVNGAGIWKLFSVCYLAQGCERVIYVQARNCEEAEYYLNCIKRFGRVTGQMIEVE